MVKIVWSNTAKNDLKSIFKYISKNSIFYAKYTTNKLIKRTFILKEFPNIGKNVPEFENDHLRELIEDNYRIVYLTSTENVIVIVTIWHSSRDLRNFSI